jgi:hypothetical protein
MTLHLPRRFCHLTPVDDPDTNTRHFARYTRRDGPESTLTVVLLSGVIRALQQEDIMAISTAASVDSQIISAAAKSVDELLLPPVAWGTVVMIDDDLDLSFADIEAAKKRGGKRDEEEEEEEEKEESGEKETPGDAEEDDEEDDEEDEEEGLAEDEEDVDEEDEDLDEDEDEEDEDEDDEDEDEEDDDYDNPDDDFDDDDEDDFDDDDE